MRKRSTRRIASWLVGTVLVLGTIDGGVARAESDAFAIGDGHVGAKTVAGTETVNAYAPVAADVAAGATQIAIGPVLQTSAAVGFAAGDLVLVWRATGVAQAVPGVASGNQTPLVLASVENADVGRWELARVATAAASSLTLTKPLVNAWKKDVTQVVKVPEYTTLTVPNGARLAATKWQPAGSGYAGGIVAFFANATVTVDGVVDASAKGFRGGEKLQRVGVVLSCANDDGTVEQGYAEKGESVVAKVDGAGGYTSLYGNDVGGKGNRSLGAGGGNCVENGGGGGANSGAGGRGGESTLNTVTGTNRGGLGGAPLTYPLADAAITDPRAYSRFTMGGGGGAGEQKNGVGSAGGAGGGVIFVRARALAGAGTLEANGETAQNAGLFNGGNAVLEESDGAGGGGAGGTVLVRVVDDATCGSIAVAGGNGGDSRVTLAGGIFGPGGGGGGGRALVQSDTGTCPITSNAGAPGASGNSARNATTGGAGDGRTIPPDVGGLCTTNGAPAQCANPNPSCDTTRGFCTKCNGPLGGGTTQPCESDTQPVCVTTGPDAGTCKGCARDLGVAGDDACGTAAAPYCETSGPDQGKCGKCDADTDCVGPTHAGPKCNVAAGACGQACTKDTDCKGTEWCSQGVCIPKTPNSQPVPNLPPDATGQCTPDVGGRVCLSGVCEEDDDLCGLKNGDECNGKKEECRSAICFAADDLCGLPSGQPCTGNGDCRSALCDSGVCAGCNTDVDCAVGKVCDQATKQCVDGCRPGAKSGDGGATRHGLCPSGQDCVARDGSALGDCRPHAGGDLDGGASGGDAGVPFDDGIVEGGGCACRTSSVATFASAGSPLAVLAAAAASVLAARRRFRKR